MTWPPPDQEQISISSIPKEMEKVATPVRSYLSGLRVDPSGLTHLRECFDADECPSIDYDKYASHFAYAYFLQNYWKACLTFLRHPPHIATRILDVGCGSGATSLAYLAYLDSLVPGPIEVKLLLLDRSQAQLDLARRLFSSALPKLQNVKVVCDYRCTDFLQWDHTSCSPELILQGHVLTENRRSVSAILSKTADCVAADGRIYAIERKRDSIWGSIAASASTLAFANDYDDISSDDPVLTIVRARMPTSDLVTKSLVIRAPERKILATLVKRYFTAWRQQSVPLLDGIFAVDAEYQVSFPLRLRPFIASAVLRVVPSAIVLATAGNQLAMVSGLPGLRLRGASAGGTAKRANLETPFLAVIGSAWLVCSAAVCSTAAGAG
jgi:SAM-dependent methyltransferase